MSFQKTTEEFIRDAKLVHGDKFDYSLTEYKNSRTKVEIICSKHGSFWQRPDVHVSQGSECPKCKGRDVSLEERFWNKVNKNGCQIEYMDSPCWEWTASKQKSGYGAFRSDITAHIFSYELHNGPILKDSNGRRAFHVLHKCDNRKCVNPDHLFLGNDKDNMQDAAIKGRLPHKLTKDNVRIMRKMYETGKFSYAELGRLFNIDPVVISSAINRRTWAHVE